MGTEERVDVFVDGACRGNPGPAGLGIVFPNKLGIEYSRYLGKATNNIAEYNAIIDALVMSKDLGAKRLTIHSDSQLVVKQLKGEWTVKNLVLSKLWARAIKLMEEFSDVKFVHEKRKNPAIQWADRLANAALDKVENK